MGTPLTTEKEIEDILKEQEKFRKTSKEVEVEDVFSGKCINDYLNKNSDPNLRPFACPYLIVVPENLTFTERQGEHFEADVDYKKGDLVCTQENGYPRCTIAKQSLIADEKGGIHLTCKNAGFKLEAKITNIDAAKT